jgi:hypothetical protein
VLYECLTGRAPHVHSDIGALLWAQCHEDVPPVTSVRPELPAALDKVMATALAKRPADRYTSCTELADELSRAVNGGRVFGSRRHKPPRRKVNWRPFAAIAAAAAVIAAAIVVVVNTAGDDGLLLRIPPPLSGDCDSIDTTLPGAENALSCRDGHQRVRFNLFTNRSTMDIAYASIVRKSDIARDSGDCTVAAGAEHRYPNDGDQVGRVFCGTDDTIRLVWTDDRKRTIAEAETRGADDQALVRAWTGWVGIPPFPTVDEQSLIDLVELSACERTQAGTLATFRDLEAAIDCDPVSDGATTVSYYRFSNVDAMRRTYDQHADEVNAPAGADCVNGPQPSNFLGTRPFDLRTVGLGSMLCYLGARGTPVLEWTIEPLKVMVRATGSNTPADLVAWFDRTFGLPLPKIVEAENATARPPFPQPEESALLRHVPECTRKNCMRPPEDQIEANVATESTAAVVCGPSSGATTIFYYQFSDKATMDQAHVDQSTVSGGNCLAGPPNFSADALYSWGGDTGRLLCGTAHNNGPYLIWTSDRTNVLALAFEGYSEADLISWWQNDAGPT